MTKYTMYRLSDRQFSTSSILFFWINMFTIFDIPPTEILNPLLADYASEYPFM